MAKKEEKEEKEEVKLTPRDKEVLKKIIAMGEKLVKEAKAGENLNMSIPVRGSANVKFDAKLKKIVLGEKVAHRYMFNVGHARKFMQSMLVLAFVKKDLLENNLTATIRDLYYAKKRTIPGTKEDTIEEQEESNAAIVDMEVALDTFREAMHLKANPRGRMVGDMVITDELRGEKSTIDLSQLGTGGLGIPSIVEQLEFKKVNVDFVLHVEKVAIWERLNEDKFWKKHKCLLMTTEGQAARGTRRLLSRFSQELKLPIYSLTDADPYGWYIYSTIKYGSMALAHESTRLGVPDMHFMGMSMSDIEHYNLQKVTIKAKDVDIKRAQEIQGYEWFKDKRWQEQIKLFLEKKYKAELQALSSKNLQYISQTYIPEKIKNEDFLP
ncbi:MAG TPA: DNA topoisomerase IV subunit A [Candidatus Norongarragalinales archaeon]|jgi:DNA topoisomerase-6 subunit A|nr:DNA topoisomerase IV subunit A [Candidatus Norongarragalinales archaeon]